METNNLQDKTLELIRQYRDISEEEYKNILNGIKIVEKKGDAIYINIREETAQFMESITQQALNEKIINNNLDRK